MAAEKWARKGIDTKSVFSHGECEIENWKDNIGAMSISLRVVSRLAVL